MFQWLKKILKPLTSAGKPTPATLHTCIHESGHYLVAWLFSEDFEIKLMTTDPQSMEAGWNGGFGFTKKEKGHETIQDAERAMLIFMAGLAATTIFSKGANYVASNLGKFPNNSTMLDSAGADVDYKLIQQRAFRIGGYYRLNDRYVQWGGFQYVFYYLMVKEIWQTLELIAQKLYEADDRKLTGVQLEEIITNEPHYEKLKRIRSDYLSARYPLTRGILSQVRID